jgi:hypothetical protein
MPSEAADLAHRLARDAEAVCRYYLSNGRRQGRYWLVGDVANTAGRSLFVRLKGPDSGKGAAGKWTDYVAAVVMLRICDWVLSHRRLTASTQHNAGALVLNELAEARASLLTDTMTDWLKADGLFDEIISWKLRLFVRTDATGTGVLQSSWSAIRSCASPSGRLRDAP